MPSSPVCRLLALVLVATSARLLFAADETPNLPCGACLGIAPDSNQPVVVPLESTEVVLDVKPGLVEGQVIQTFTNRTITALEATYLYPLPAAATITGFELRYPDHVVCSEVREKGAAHAIYETAKAEGRKAALLVQQDPALFSTAVANFLPGETVQVVLRFTQPLDLRADVAEVRFPMVTGDKYFPAETTPGTAGNAAPNVARRSADMLTDNHVYAFDVQVAGFPASTITSPSHGILVAPATNDPQRLRVSLAQEITVPDRDFVLRIETRQTAQPQSTMVVQHTDTGDYGLLAVFPPGMATSNGPRRPRDVLFLIDHSGSMEGVRMESARLGVIGCLNALLPQDRFHIAVFDSVTEFFRPEWKPALSSELDAARAYVGEIKARGGTEMQPALAASFAKFEPNERDQILIFLTDGDVGNTDSLLTLVESNIGRVRLFAFGIGGVPNTALLQKMAELGRGQSRFIANDGEVQRELTDLFATLDAPVLTDARFSLHDAQGNLVEYTSFPEKLSDVFLGRPLQSVFRWKQGVPTSAVIDGQEGGRSVQYQVALNPTAMRGDGLEKEFGRRLYNDTGMLLRRATTESERAVLREELLATALQFQLVTDLTSRVAVDLQVARASSAPLTTSRVGQYRPADYGGAYVQSSSGSEVLILSPFSVVTDSDRGYVTGFPTSRSNLAASAYVLTREFLDAVGTRTLDDALPFTLDPQVNAGLARGGADTGLLNGLPIATIIDPMTIERLSFEPFGPSKIIQQRAGRPLRSSFTAQAGDEGLARFSLKAATSVGGNDDSPLLAILSWAKQRDAQKSLLLETRNSVGGGTARTSAQWRGLQNYGDVRLARASFEREVGDKVMLEVTAAWHELQRGDPRQFRLGSPTNQYEGLGFFNLDLLTSQTRRLRDAIGQAELSGREQGAFKQGWSVRARWHRQESEWVTPFANDAVASARTTHRLDGTYAVVPFEQLSLTSQLGWAEYRTPRTTDERQNTMRGGLGFTWELGQGLGLFGALSSEENLPWVSTGAWRTSGSSAVAITPEIEKRRGSEFGLRGARGDRVSGEIGLFREDVSGVAYRDWAWERSRELKGLATTDGLVRAPVALATWGSGEREGWLASTSFKPNGSLSLKAAWFQAWKSTAPYEGGDTHGSLAGRYQFLWGSLRGLMVGASASYRDALTFNDGYRLQGGLSGDVMLGWRTRALGGRETVFQVNFNNVAGRSWQPTRFAPDPGRTVLFSVVHGF